MYHFKLRRDTRAATGRIQDLVDQGILSAETVMAACLSYMGESEVADMAEREGFFDFEDAE